VDDITRQAGVSRATFYLHFSGKRQMVTELFERAAPDFQSFIAELNALENPTWQSMRDWMERVDSYWRDNQEILGTLTQVVVREPELAATWWAGARRVADSISGDLLPGGEAGRETAMVRALLFMMAFDRMQYFRHVLDTGLDSQVVLDACTDLWCAALDPHGSEPGGSDPGGSARRHS
jgi:AcrR family transcriptional regulator